MPVKVKVFLLEVEEELDEWPEQRRARARLVTPAKAADAVDEPELAELIRELAAGGAKKKAA